MAYQIRNRFRWWNWVWAIALIATLGMAQRASAQTLTNADIVKMVQAKLGDDVIISEIKHSTCKFDTSPSALIKLKEAGVSDKVLEAMTEAARPGSGVRTPASPSSSNAAIPLPKNYGVYAVDGGHLVELDVQHVKEYKTAAVRLGQRNGGANVMQGQAVASSSVANILEFGPGFKIIVYYQGSGMTSPLMIAKVLRLKPMVFVRNVTVNTGPPNDVTRTGVENGWDSGGATQLLESASGAQPRPLQMRFRPVPGHRDMVIATPSRPLRPGVYQLAPAEGGIPFLSGSAVLFAVPPVREAEGRDCVDATITYSFALSNDRFTPCGRPSAPSGPAAGVSSNGSASAAGGSVPLASCGDYNSCLRAGFRAGNASDWQASIDDFHAAAAEKPSNPEPWTLLAGPYLQTGQIENFSQSWNKALKLGGTVGFEAWRQMAFGIERGTFQLSPSLVSFKNQKGKTVFSAPPAKVRVIGAFTIQDEAYLRLRVAGKNYNLTPVPFRINCQVLLTVECPAKAVTQQQIVTRYVAQTIPKLASGAIAQQTPSHASSNCAGAADLGYSIQDGAHTYKVEGFGPPGPNRVHVFLNQAGAVVRNSSLLHQLALGAWTREMIVNRYSAGNGSGAVDAALAADANLEGWEDATDILARATVESIKAVVTGGTSLSSVAPDLTLGVVEQQLTNPKIAMAHWAHAGMEQSLTDYKEIESLLPAARETTVKLSDLETIEPLYSEANTLFSVDQAIVGIIAPTTWQDEFANYISSAVSELKPSLPASQTFLTLNNVLKLEELVAATTHSFSAYKQSLSLALAVSASTKQKVSMWATQAATACTSSAARNSAAPRTVADASF